ncbi:PH domain-containing protein [Nakamurella deserti]|uniref:PH domain-containing protein n=1 Tax=Nakamurella deserti TaxID=2164074 RepID=UPI000DBE9EC6|nr:PH domain-containing protein [Nakamurella deserti]
MTELHWGPRPGAFVFGGVLLATGVLWMIVAGTAGDRVIAGAVMIVVLGAMVLGWRMRDRLRASVDGIVVGSVSGSRTIPWSRVRRMEVVGRKRLGTVNNSLEIDLDDDELLVFTRMELGQDPADVAAELTKIRTGG